MLKHYGSSYSDRVSKPSLLFLVGEQRRDIIPKTLMNPSLPTSARIQVDELVVYGTGIMESFERDFGDRLIQTQGAVVRWIVVFSPTGCDAMLRALGLLDPSTGRYNGEKGKENTFIATIGPTTRDYLKNTFGYTPHVCASRPSPEGVEEGIREFRARGVS